MPRATIAVTAQSWEESRISQSDAEHPVVSAVFRTTYAGDLEGSSTAGLLISYVAGDPDRPSSLAGPYLGYEQVSGTLAGRSGSFVLAARGEHTGSVARTEVQIVPRSGTGELVSIHGSGHYAADARTYTLTLDYDFR